MDESNKKECFRVNITINIVISKKDCSIYFILHINEEVQYILKNKKSTVHTTMQTDNKNQMLK